MMPSIPVNTKKQRGTENIQVKTDTELAYESLNMQQKIFHEEFEDLCKT